MGLLSPQENSELGLIRALLNLHFCKWHFLPIFTQPDQFKLFLLVLSNKFLKNGYKHSGTLFLGSSYHYHFKNIAHVRGICKFDPNCICVFVFVCLCICICVFVFVFLYLCACKTAATPLLLLFACSWETMAVVPAASPPTNPASLSTFSSGAK